MPGERLRLEAYKKLATVATEHELAEIADELNDRYGAPPEPVQHLLEVARLRVLARQAGIGDIGTQGKFVRFGPVESLPESRQLRLERLYKGAKLNPALKTILVPAPMTSPVGGKPVRNTEVLTWAAQLIRSILLDDAAAA